MLCYHSSRKLADVNRDTFKWLRDNSVVVRLVFYPLLFISILVTLQVFLWMPAGGGGGRYYDTIELLQPFIPLLTDSSTRYLGDNTFPILIYTVIGGAVMLILTPLLIYYFIDHRSIIDITYGKYLDVLKSKWRPTLIACIMVMGSCAIICASIFWINLLIGVILMFALPFAILHTKEQVKWQNPAKTKVLWCMVFTILIFIIISLLPDIIYSFILSLCKEWLEKMVPGFFNNSDASRWIFDSLYLMIRCMSVGYAVMVFAVSSTLMHGIIFTKD